MPGSATFTPFSPPIGGAASVFEVLRYDSESQEKTVLPNIKCLSIHYVEGAVPPTAQFEYVLDDTDPSSPFPSKFEDLWPLHASGPYVIQPDDELIVVEYPENDDPFMCFHGFAQIPQIDGAGGGQRVTFVASGVAVRLWDDVVGGATYRPSDDPEAGAFVETGLPCWFNPGGRPNCTPVGHDIDDGTDRARPCFVWPDTDQGANKQTKWTLGKFVRYLCWTFNPDEKYIRNPVAPRGTLDDYLRAIAPRKDAPTFDVADSSTYDATPIEVRSTDVTGMPWIEAVAEQLHKYGFEIFFNLNVDDGGNPRDELIIYRKDGLDAVTPKPVNYPRAGSTLLDSSPGFSGFALARDGHSMANEWSVETAPAKYEVSVVLAPGFTPAAADCADATAIAGFDKAKVASGTEAVRRKYRYYVFDECGFGHWDSGTSTFVADKPTSLDDVLGKPLDGKPQYVARPRAGSGKLLSVDDKKEPRRAILAISTDYNGEAPALWDPNDTSSHWRDLGPANWQLDEEVLGAWIATNADNPEDWRLPKNDGAAPPPGIAAPAPVVRGITSQAAPDTTNPRFFLRLTTVIEGDAGIEATAKKRLASPSKFAIRRRVDAKDHFRQHVVTESSAYNAQSPPADDTVLDNTADATAHAEAMRTTHEFPPVAGVITIPWISHSYGVGDLIGGIAGRGIDLALNAGLQGGESPKYPIVVGFSWSCQNPQSTTLQLSDRRGEPDRGYDQGRR